MQSVIDYQSLYFANNHKVDLKTQRDRHIFLRFSASSRKIPISSYNITVKYMYWKKDFGVFFEVIIGVGLHKFCVLQTHYVNILGQCKLYFYEFIFIQIF